ncbi:hypothetical protein [Variovorax sp. YR752]|uniref:hypothetical protein n=1 Tax=Variovorax sp. YR752 TaxID=1884383 RepID=UPI0031382612
MELQSLASTPSTTTAPMLTADAQREARVTMSCRCAGCGSTVAFDALIVSCGCADDNRAADSTLH